MPYLISDLRATETPFAKEKYLFLLGIPTLVRIHMLESLGFLPAIPTLPGVGVGAHAFSETRYLLEQVDDLNGENTLNAQIAAHLLNDGWIKRTREEYDHHVTLTDMGWDFISRYASLQQG